MNTKRILSILLAALAAVSLAACGGGGGGGGNGTTNPGGGSTPPSANLAACTDGAYDTSTYQGVTPCLTVTGLASGQSVTVSDGSATLTEAANGTYTFPGLANGSEQGVAVQPTVAFSVTATTGGATCSLAGGGATAGQVPSATAYETSALCAKYPAVPPNLPKVTTMPGVSGTAQVIASPTIVPVYISTGSLATGNEANDATFLSQLVNSQEWGLLSQYGIGAATVDAAVTVDAGAWSQYHIVTAGDLSAITQGVAAQGVTLTPSSVLVIYLPPTVAVSPAISGGTGYTGTVAVGSANVPFALVMDDNTNDVAYVPDSSVYWEAEAGIVNDVTNAGGNGYAWMSANPDLWLGTSVDYDSGVDGEYASGATSIGVGTVCLSADGGIMQAPDISTGDIVSIWSQADANAGRNPCQPNADYYDNTQPNPTVTLSDSSTPFVGVVPEGTTAVTGTLAGISRTDQAIVVAPGQSVTVQAQVFTTAAVQDMQAGVGVISYINVEGVTSQGMQSGQPRITVSSIKNLTRPAATGINNGDTIEFTITASGTPFKGMYVLTVELGSESAATPIGVTNGTTWQ